MHKYTCYLKDSQSQMKSLKSLTLLPRAFYDFLSYGVGFLSHTPENNVKII